MRYLTAALALAAWALTASPTSACAAHKNATQAAATDASPSDAVASKAVLTTGEADTTVKTGDKACCNKAGAGADCRHKAKDAKHAGCPHASDAGDVHKAVMKGEGSAEHGGAHGKGAGCPLAAKREMAGKGCKMSAAALAAAKEYRGTGKVVCARCELKKSDSCNSVFQASNGSEIYPLCGEGMSESLLKLTRHGEVEVTVHGRLANLDEGGQMLCLEGFSVGTL